MRVMNNVCDYDGVTLLKGRFNIDFYKIAKDTCFLTPSASTIKQHKPSNHIYNINRLGELRVGWINQEGYGFALQGKFREALTRFDEVLRLEPQYIHAWNHKGLCNYFLERYPTSLKCFNAAIKLNRQFIEAYINKGCLLQRFHNFENALNCFEEAESINSRSFENWTNKSISLIALGDFTSALHCLDRAVALNPVKPAIYALRSICFLALEWYREGCEDLKVALQLDPLNKIAIELFKISNAIV
jgi:tetratricopeptide (TPR) repeat protein